MYNWDKKPVSTHLDHSEVGQFVTLGPNGRGALAVVLPPTIVIHAERLQSLIVTVLGDFNDPHQILHFIAVLAFVNPGHGNDSALFELYSVSGNAVLFLMVNLRYRIDIAYRVLSVYNLPSREHIPSV